MSFLLILKEQSEIIGVTNIANCLLDDPRFPVWSGSPKPEQHHYGDGGLLLHTYEVVQLCLNLRDTMYSHLDKRTLFLASLMHDWGKLWDYQRLPKESNVRPPPGTEYPGVWQSAPHKRIIHHVSRSAIEWSKAVEKTGECKDIEWDVSHAILAHHGRREFGSPVAPKSAIAWLLHLCDGISARLNDCDRLDRY